MANFLNNHENWVQLYDNCWQQIFSLDIVEYSPEFDNWELQSNGQHYPCLSEEEIRNYI